MLKYKVMSGEYEVQVTENSFHAAALLAMRLFDLKNNSELKLAPIIMITTIHDGEWCVIDTQIILDEVGVKYKRVLNVYQQEQENGEDSDS